MKRKMLAALLSVSMALTVSAVAFAAETEDVTEAAEETEEAAAETEASEEAESDAEEEAISGEDYLSLIQGSYVELFPEMAKDEYREIWLEKTGAIAGEESAEETTDMLLGMCMAEIYGQEAIDEYGDGSEGYAFDCYFLGGVETFTVDGNTISGTDENGEEVFSHTYDYVSTDENGFFLFQSEDEESGQFTYFCFAPDTMETTYHLEFRYSEDAADLASWFEGSVAYWNAAGIAADYDDEIMEKVIDLFATENLAEE